LRLEILAAKRFQRCHRATGVIRKMLMVGEVRLPRLDAPHLLPKVLAGVRLVDGIAPIQELAP